MASPQTSVNLLDLMTPREQARVKQREEILEEIKGDKVTREWLGIAELGYYFGWTAVQDWMNDVITSEQADMFVRSARKIHSGHVLDQALASLAGNATKKGAFEKIMKSYIRDMRV